MGVDQLVTGGDVDNPVVDSLETDTETISKLAVSLEKTTQQTISAATDTKVDWDGEETDDNNEFDLANNKFSPFKQGDYKIVCSALWRGVQDQDRVRWRIYKNGSLYKQAAKAASGADNQSHNAGFYLPDLSTSDTIEIYIRSPDADNNITGVTTWTWAAIVRQG